MITQKEDRLLRKKNAAPIDNHFRSKDVDSEFQERAEMIARILGGMRRSGDGWLCHCPSHDDRTPSLSIKDGGDGRILINCFAGCDQRDVFQALRTRGLLCGLRHSLSPIMSRPLRLPQRGRPFGWSLKAAQIWKKTVPLEGTPVEQYLAHRGCCVPLCGDLRCLPPDARRIYPAMVARITDAITNMPVSLHFTLLQPGVCGKAPIERPKVLLKGHRKSGGVIRLVDDADVTMGLGLAEGIETALAVMATGWRPVWAAIDAGNLANFPSLSGIDALTIFADHDNAGISAAERCAARWNAGGREARIVMPLNIGTDWADTTAV